MNQLSKPVLNFNNKEVLKIFNSIFIGAMIRRFARDSDIIGTSEYKKYLKEVRVFFIKCVKYLQISIPVLKNYIIKSSAFLHLPKRHHTTLDELHV